MNQTSGPSPRAVERRQAPRVRLYRAVMTALLVPFAFAVCGVGVANAATLLGDDHGTSIPREYLFCWLAASVALSAVLVALVRIYTAGDK